MSEKPDGKMPHGNEEAGRDEAKKKFDAFMSLNVDPFEDWPAGEEGAVSSEDEEWNPPSQDSPSSHSDSESDGSQIQDGLLQSDEESDDPFPLDPTAKIAKRTRARVPLTNVLLSDLEGMLQPEGDIGFHGDLDIAPYNMNEPEETLQWEENEYSHSSSPDHTSGELMFMNMGGMQIEQVPQEEMPPMNPVESEQREKGYEQFLQVFQQGTSDLPPELAEDDPEYHVDPESYTSMPDEWYNLVGKISRSEVEALLREGAPGSGGGGVVMTGEAEVGLEEEEGLPESPSSGSSGYLSSSSSEPEDENSPEMTNSQRLMLHQQMLQMFQLQLQIYLLCRHIDGNLAVAEDIWKLHNRFVALSTSATTSYKPPAHHLAAYQPQSSFSTPTGPSARSTTPLPGVMTPSSPHTGINPHMMAMGSPGSVSGPREIIPSQPSSLMTDPSLIPPSTSLENSPEVMRVTIGGMPTQNLTSKNHRPSAHVVAQEHTPNIVFGEGDREQATREQHEGGRRPNRQVKPFLASVLALPTVVLVNQEVLARLHVARGVLTKAELNRYLGMYQTVFRPNMLPNVDTRATMSAMTSMSTVSATQGMVSTGATSARYRWSPVEDDLLAIGFSLFHKNWNLIRLRLLPSKDPLAIATRFKNKTSKKSKDNPIKSALAYNTRPLTNDERDLLTLGVSQLGHDFDLISSRYLPSRKPQFLAKLWRQMTSTSKSKKTAATTTTQRSKQPVQTTTGITASPSFIISTSSPYTPFSSLPASSNPPQDPYENQYATSSHSSQPSQSYSSHDASQHLAHPSSSTMAHTSHLSSHTDPHPSLQQEEERFEIVLDPELHNDPNSLQVPDIPINRPILPAVSIEDIDRPTSSRDRNRALQKADTSARSRSSSVSSSDSNSGAPVYGSDFLRIPHGDEDDDISYSARSWDSDASDANIIESALASSEAASYDTGSGSDSDGLGPPTKRSKFSELGNSSMHSYVPAVSTTLATQHYYQQHAGATHHESQVEGHYGMAGSHHDHSLQQGAHSSDMPMESMRDEEHGGLEEQQTKEREERYPEDYHTRPFHAADYLDMLLHWEAVWQEEAVQAAIAAAETVRLEKLSGKVKPVASSSSKSRSKSKGSKNSKSKLDKAQQFLLTAPTIVSAANSEWEHELWLSPPTSPEPSMHEQNTMHQPMSSLSAEAMVNQETNPHAETAPPIAHHHSAVDSLSSMMMDDGNGLIVNPLGEQGVISDAMHLSSDTGVPPESLASGLSHQHSSHIQSVYDMPVSKNQPNRAEDTVPPTDSSRLNLSLQPTSQKNYHSPQGSMVGGKSTHAHDTSMKLDISMTSPLGPSGAAPIAAATSSKTVHADHELAMMQKTIEKEVRHASTHFNPKLARHPWNTDPSSTTSPGLPYALPGGMFSVLTPEGRVICSDDFLAESPPPPSSSSPSSKQPPPSKHY